MAYPWLPTGANTATPILRPTDAPTFERTLQKMIQERAEEIAREYLAKQTPVDDFPNEQVLFFYKTQRVGFRPHPQTYHYSAIKAPSAKDGGKLRWYVSAVTSTALVAAPLTWEQLLDFIDGGPIWYATAWEQLR